MGFSLYYLVLICIVIITNIIDCDSNADFSSQELCAFLPFLWLRIRLDKYNIY